MLLERLFYADGFPIRVTIATLTEDPRHYHPDIEFIYVLSGEIELRNGYYTYHLHAGDIFTNSGNEVHSMRAVTQDNVIAQIQISTQSFSQYFPNLSKACYRTYFKKSSEKNYTQLKSMLLQLLLKYEHKELNYKNECLYLMVDIIKHLDTHFNCFAFDGDMVVGFDRGNQLAVERISRIVQFIYQNYADNLTLSMLSEMEFLNSFYISHLIKDFTGMGFRDFLCFARMEMSEVMLLGSDKKVSQIAREVGFSTTAYYRKYFTRWFGLEPQEYRALYQPQIKSQQHPLVCRELLPSRAIALLQDVYTGQQTPENALPRVSSLTQSVEVRLHKRPLRRFGSDLHILVSAADYAALGPALFETLERLEPSRVVLVQSASDAQESGKLSALLEELGFSVEQRKSAARDRRISYAYDSIVYAAYLLNKAARRGSTTTEVFLRDSGDSHHHILQGQPALVTSNGVKKPSFYVYAALSHFKGEVLAQGEHYCVVRTLQEGAPIYVVFAYHYGADTDDLCTGTPGLLDTKNAINGYRDELNLGISLDLRPGTYSIARCSMTRTGNVFSHMAALDFQSQALIPYTWVVSSAEGPALETYLEDVRSMLNLNFSLRGYDMRMVIIRSCGRG